MASSPSWHALVDWSEWLRIPGGRVTVDSPLASKVPSIAIFTFLIPIFSQALLLHPIFPASLSRPLRLLLLPLSLYYSVHSSFDYGFRPREHNVGANFVVGVMGAYGIMKALEWALARDLTPYTWVGFDQQGYIRHSPTSEAPAAKENGHSRQPKHEKALARNRYLHKIRQHNADTDSPIDILRWTGSLCLSMRGNGWAFGPVKRSQARPFSTNYRIYLRQALVELFWSHCVLVACGAVITTPVPKRALYLARHLPNSFSASTIESLAFASGGLALGVAALAGLTCGMQCASLSFFIATTILRALPLPELLKLPPFDPHQYPPLFQIRAPTSVARFWSEQWHYFFARPFKFLGYQTGMMLFEPIGGKVSGQAAGVLLVFAISSWLHEHALWSAIHTFSKLQPNGMSFYTRWGTSIYFMSQGIAIVLENAFTKLTKRRVEGLLGFVWTISVAAGMGIFLARCWLGLGLANGIPEPAEWTWQRYVIPLTAIIPRPFGTKI